MKNRKRLSPKRSKRMFKRHANKTHKFNMPDTHARGGHRL